EQERAARGRRAGRARSRRRHVRPVRTADRERTESAGRGGGRVTEESGHAVEDVPPLEESAEDLRVPRVDPFTAGLYGVPPGDERDVVLHLEALHRLVDVRREEERVAETERRKAGVRAHRRIGGDPQGGGGVRGASPPGRGGR